MVLFVAIFAATISTPIAVSADWVVCNILVAKTARQPPGGHAHSFLGRLLGFGDTAVAPVEAEEVAAGTDGPEPSIADLKSFDEEYEEMLSRMKHFSSTLPSDKAKEFCGKQFLKLVPVFIFSYDAF
jgi:hypothetical protein